MDLGVRVRDYATLFSKKSKGLCRTFILITQLTLKNMIFIVFSMIQVFFVNEKSNEIFAIKNEDIQKQISELSKPPLELLLYILAQKRPKSVYSES